jgi:hypothetical protein
MSPRADLSPGVDPSAKGFASPVIGSADSITDELRVSLFLTAASLKP